MNNNKLNFSSIVLSKFPFSDGVGYKRRPALVLKDCEDGDVPVCRITMPKKNNSIGGKIKNKVVFL